MCRYHGVAEAEAREAFKKLGVVSENHATDSYKGYDAQGRNINSIESFLFVQGQEITWDKFTNLWKQYFSSDEPTAAGNFIFGKTSF